MNLPIRERNISPSEKQQSDENKQYSKWHLDTSNSSHLRHLAFCVKDLINSLIPHCDVNGSFTSLSILTSIIMINMYIYRVLNINHVCQETIFQLYPIKQVSQNKIYKDDAAAAAIKTRCGNSPMQISHTWPCKKCRASKEVIQIWTAYIIFLVDDQ